MKLSKVMFPLLLSMLVCPPLPAQQTDSPLTSLDSLEGEKKVKALNELFRSNLASDPVTAVGFATTALMLAEEISDKRGMAAAYNNLGVAYRNQGALDKALEYYLTSLKVYDSLQNAEGVATTKNNIANIYSMKKDYTQARRYLEESHTLFREINDPFRLVGSMNNLGNLYHDINLDDKALEYYTSAYELSDKNGAPFGDPLTNIGNIHFNQGDYKTALDFYARALSIERKNNNRLAILNTLTNMGIAHAKAGESKNAGTILDEALKLSEELQAFTSLPTIYKASAENFSKQQKWKDAYEMQLKYEEIREKIYSEESSRNIAQMEMVLDFQEKERELAILRKEDEIKTLELRNTRLFIILSILGVIIILGALNFIFLDRRRKLV